MLIKIVEIKYYEILWCTDNARFLLEVYFAQKKIFKKGFPAWLPYCIYYIYFILYIYIYIYIYMYVCMPIYICLSVKYECFLQPSEIWQIIHILTFPKKPLFTSFLSRFIFICLFVCFIFMSIMSIMALAFFF